MDTLKKQPRRRFHSPQRIAAELDISNSMVYKLIKKRRLEAERFDGMIRVTDESYRAFLKSGANVA